MGKRFLCYDPDDVDANKMDVDKDGVLRKAGGGVTHWNDLEGKPFGEVLKWVDQFNLRDATAEPAGTTDDGWHYVSVNFHDVTKYAVNRDNEFEELTAEQVNDSTIRWSLPGDNTWYIERVTVEYGPLLVRSMKKHYTGQTSSTALVGIIGTCLHCVL